MLCTKTHYEQVPLEVVRKLLEEQIRLQIILEQDQGISGGTPKEIPLSEQEPSALKSRAPSHVEITNQ